MNFLHSIEDQQEYYNDYWAHRSRQLNPHELLRLGEIFKGLSLVRETTRKNDDPLTICDFGSGWGWLSNYLSSFGQVTGVELSNDAVKQAKSEFPHVEFVCADITQWKPDRRFDLVVSSEVLEHVPNKQDFFNTLREIVRPGGWVIITTPNKKVQKEWDVTNGGGQMIEDWCSLAEMRKLAQGFEIIDHYTFLFDFAYVGKFRVLSAPKLHRMVKKLRLWQLYNYLRSSLGLYQIFIARKAQD